MESASQQSDKQMSFPERHLEMGRDGYFAEPGRAGPSEC